MAVQIIENWSKIIGIVRSLQLSTEVVEFMAVEVEVQAVEPVEGFPNLLGDAVGKNLIIHVPEALAVELGMTILDRIECRVRQAGPNRYFVHREHVIVMHSNE
jgi:hypothetical protein